MRVDAHHHFWDPATADYPWMTEELAPIRRRFGPKELRPELERHRIDATVLVQTRSSEDETREFLALADAEPFVAGVVGWVDLTAPDVPDRLAALRAAPGGRHLVGIRHQVHDEPDPGWLDRTDVRRGLRAVSAAGLAYDLLVRTRELPTALRTARARPELRLVLDHCAKPPLRAGEDALAAWWRALEPLTREPNVTCKLSGLVTEASWPTDLTPVVRRVVEAFGHDRVLYGSDWPVCLLAATYTEVIDLAATTPTPGLFGPTATRVYELVHTPGWPTTALASRSTRMPRA